LNNISGHAHVVEAHHKRMEPPMSSNHYTNVVLTVVALALSVIAVENIVRPSKAQSVQSVAICDTSGKFCLDVNRDSRGSFINVQPIR
jgi:hypothetical protein